MKAICSVILVLAVVGTVLTADSETELIRKGQETFEKCKTETGVTETQLMQLSMITLPKDKEPLCFLACMAKYFKVMNNDPNNTVNKDSIAEILETLKGKMNDAVLEENIKKGIDKCTSEHKGDSDKCVSAKMAMECVVKFVQDEKLIKN